jgi:hypothetical protein
MPIDIEMRNFGTDLTHPTDYIGEHVSGFASNHPADLAERAQDPMHFDWESAGMESEAMTFSEPVIPSGSNFPGTVGEFAEGFGATSAEAGAYLGNAARASLAPESAVPFVATKAYKWADLFRDPSDPRFRVAWEHVRHPMHGDAYEKNKSFGQFDMEDINWWRAKAGYKPRSYLPQNVQYGQNPSHVHVHAHSGPTQLPLPTNKRPAKGPSGPNKRPKGSGGSKRPIGDLPSGPNKRPKGPITPARPKRPRDPQAPGTNKRPRVDRSLAYWGTNPLPNERIRDEYLCSHHTYHKKKTKRRKYRK